MTSLVIKVNGVEQVFECHTLSEAIAKLTEFYSVENSVERFECKWKYIFTKQNTFTFLELA